jgi:hypothetical protein
LRSRGKTLALSIMLRKFQYICLVGSIALIGADRIDLFVGQGPFVLSPFLVLAPLLFFTSLFRGSHDVFQLKITPPMRRQIPFIVVSCVFFILAFISIPFGLDPERGVVAFADFLLVAVFGYYISVQVLAEPAQNKLIVRAVTLSLLLYVFFCTAECIAWAHGLTMDQSPLPWMQSMFAPDTIGPWLPRLSGATVDPNRAGFVLTMYLFLLDRFVTRSRFTLVLRITIAVLVLLTLSRSAILCWAAYYLFSATFWRRLASRRGALSLASVVLVGTFVGVAYQGQFADALTVWEISDAVSARMSVDTGSSGENHILLIRRGLETWSSSAGTLVSGIGFAAAPKVLGDFFGDDKHGNFHCLYVTILAELGLPAFVLLLFLLGYPVIGRKGAISCIAAIMVFNVTYQCHTEPMLWLVLALAWSYA